ncbi:hypothetical protein ABGB18_09875 [Nonomuraea sp. B12E4]|uniref:hypothetical protein n=1 Tax=Nonomuraea sp. B12E4 TaxID=3153564 RepID=UPI00325DF5CC
MSVLGGGGGLSRKRLGRMREILAEAVESGTVPGLVALVHRRGETHVVALGTLSLPADAAGLRRTAGPVRVPGLLDGGICRDRRLTRRVLGI